MTDGTLQERVGGIPFWSLGERSLSERSLVGWSLSERSLGKGSLVRWSVGERSLGEWPMSGWSLGERPLSKWPLSSRSLGEWPLSEWFLGKRPLSKGSLSSRSLREGSLSRWPLGEWPLGERTLSAGWCRFLAAGQPGRRSVLGQVRVVVTCLPWPLWRHLDTGPVVDAGLTQLAGFLRRLRLVGDAVRNAAVVGGRLDGRFMGRRSLHRDGAVGNAGVVG